MVLAGRRPPPSVSAAGVQRGRRRAGCRRLSQVVVSAWVVSKDTGFVAQPARAAFRPKPRHSSPKASAPGSPRAFRAEREDTAPEMFSGDGDPLRFVALHFPLRSAEYDLGWTWREFGVEALRR